VHGSALKDSAHDRTTGRFRRSRALFAALLLVGTACSVESSGPSDEAAASTEPQPVEVDGAEVASSEEAPALGPGLDDGVALGGHISDVYTTTLAGVLERRYLRVVTSKNSFDFFIHDGKRGGYQYELVKAFTRHLNRKYVKGRKEVPIQFDLLPVADDQLIPMLLAGRGDMIASRMTITPERQEQVLFSVPYREVDELVVTHGLTGDHRFLHDLAGQRVSVRRSSSYYTSLQALNEQLESEGKERIHIDTVDEELGTEAILAMVAKRALDFSVADSIVAETAVAVWPELRILTGMEVRKGGQLAWATTHAAQDLATEMNAFLPRYRHGSLLGNVAVQKYFEPDHSLHARIDGERTAPLSPYDDLLRLHAERYDFDWRLMAALAYQESRFNPLASNRSGAVGFFQIKPMTAREPYIGIPDVKGPENVENNIHAGIKYLAWIKQRYFDSIPEMSEDDRMRMAMAAYNAGPRTLINARNRAVKMGLDPMLWFRNVEIALLTMRKTEPVKYVSEINQRYVSYQMLNVK
jgi:membrane-bound lytic murein transglycosylase MltF